MRDALLLVDVLDDFGHEDGRALQASFRERLPHLLGLIATARTARTPVIYANDRHGLWHGDVRRLLAELRAEPVLAPDEADAFFFKDRYSAFRHTALAVLLEELGTERLLLAGMSLEGCVTQTAIDAREHGLKVTVVASACPRIDETAASVAVDYLRRIVGARVAEDVAPTDGALTAPSARS